MPGLAAAAMMDALARSTMLRPDVSPRTIGAWNVNQHRISRLTLAWHGVPSRRDVMRALAGLGLGLGAAHLPDLAAARKKRKHRTRKGKPNEFGCLSVGQRCTKADQCCSDICQGKKGKKSCRARGSGTCDQQALAFCEVTDSQPAICNGNDNCRCFRTTAGSSFCADSTGSNNPGFCVDCTKDADCAALGFPPGSACLPLSNGNCALFGCEMGCLVPCGFVPPAA